MADITFTATNVVKGSGVTVVSLPAAAAITQGTLVYRNSSGKWAVSDCTASGTAKATGIALADAAEDQELPVQVLKANETITYGATGGGGGSGMTAGKVYVLSESGAFAPSDDLDSSDIVCVVGVAVSNTVLEIVGVNTSNAIP